MGASRYLPALAPGIDCPLNRQRSSLKSPIVPRATPPSHSDEVFATHNQLTSWIDSEAYTELVDHHFGRRILITDRHDWSAGEIILAYRGQSDVEECFKILKNPFHLALRPQHHWTDQKIEVHAFCCVLAYLLARLLHTRVQEQSSFSGSTGSLIGLLGKIRRSTVLEKVPGKPGRPRVRQVLDYPDDPSLDEFIQILGITP